ncbi:glycosyltransferase [Terrimicrobium sacchariphilum]|uniref:Glycosyltransferase n=1 Tax=Terrimicrobium sacchariphilum TaxID=690879 RepID=A0A146G3D9_TERSA|nr:glycosyltransferase [Terrimicrobium sacchariphilum]
MAGSPPAGGAHRVKVLVLCYEYPPVGGGGGRVAAQVATGLVARGHEVRVQTSGMRHLPAHEDRDGVRIERAESFRKKEDTCSVPEMALYLATSFLPALKLAREWKPDVIHAHFAVPTGVLAASVSALTRIPYVLTAHLGDVPGGVPEQTSHLFKIVDPFARILWKRAAATTAVSSYVGALARAAYAADPHVILNGIAAPANTGDQKIANKLLMVGRLSVQKNPLLAIESLALVRDLPWTLDVIGDGPLRAQMEELARQKGIADRITFRGWLDARDVHAAMAESELLFIPSLHEGLPMAAIEALHHGLVIVGSNIGGLADVLSDDENGFMCPLEAPAFAEKLQLLLTSPELKTRMALHSHKLAASFGVDRSVDGYEKVLRAVAGEKE